MKNIIAILILTVLGFSACAQYTQYGKIEYERKVNLQRTIDLMDKEEKEWMENFKSSLPKFTTNYFDMYFTTTKTIYKPGREVEGNSKMWFAQFPASENIVFTDMKTERVKATKQIYEEKFKVEDSVRKIEWKITDEIRTIANYKCRKAVGKMFDSVYVIAFYTDDIMVSGGPEMFAGLPGMIMQVTIPRLNTTWMATKVEQIAPKEEDFTISEKGKKTTQKELYDVIRSSFKDWKKYLDRNTWWCII